MWIRRFSRFFGCYCVTSVTPFRDRGHTITAKKTTKSIIIKITPSFLRTSLQNFPRSLSRACISRYVLYIEISITLLFTKFFKFLPLTLYILYWVCTLLGYEKVVNFWTWVRLVLLKFLLDSLEKLTKSTWKFGKLSSPCKVSCRFSLSAYNIFKCVSKESSEVLRAVLENTAREIDQSHCAY